MNYTYDVSPLTNEYAKYTITPTIILPSDGSTVVWGMVVCSVHGSSVCDITTLKTKTQTDTQTLAQTDKQTQIMGYMKIKTQTQAQTDKQIDHGVHENRNTD